jgi:cytochrome-b5 reductase
MPSTLMGPPIAALCPPGMCQFGSQPVAVPLIERTPVSPTSSVLRFGLPQQEAPLNLSTCACILASAQIKGDAITRPYTPISTNQQVGSFDLLIKDYGPDSFMSHHMMTLEPGDTIQFQHMDKNVKIQAPFYQYDRILLLAGGTGITPMIQALHAILGESKDNASTATDSTDNVQQSASESRQTKRATKVVLLYGSKVQEDILGRPLLEQWAKDNPDRFTMIPVLSDEPKDSSWKGERGFITKDLIDQYFPSPHKNRKRHLENGDVDAMENGDKEEKVMVFVCGPPPLYEALCGPREESQVLKGVLKELGYQPDQVYKF